MNDRERLENEPAIVQFKGRNRAKWVSSQMLRFFVTTFDRVHDNLLDWQRCAAGFTLCDVQHDFGWIGRQRHHKKFHCRSLGIGGEGVITRASDPFVKARWCQGLRPAFTEQHYPDISLRLIAEV